MGRQDLVSLLLVGTSIAIIIIVALVEHVSGTKCYKNEDLGDRDGNVYHCEEGDLTRCCVEHEAPTCCQSESSKNLEEQLQLWGTVAAMILAIALIFVCCKNDISCCNSDTSLKERISNLFNRNKAEHLVNEEDEVARNKGNFFENSVGNIPYNNPPTGYSFQSSRAMDPYNFPPLPPMSPDPDDRHRSSYA
ncbi:hypothetical protein EGW08_002672 [Elysia chlorotica]|uniref:Uncharacterized protein n=1 Tax=Elysia chlorotica TaxID=188477 RepID=A0A433U6Y3_ELYCH|nr:hypothetical protein EGW08_002672 [Elysia chlorotica]